ncbi:hypothetical protein M747DRAFT_162246 [Aspergillus niger ATCC 13496]|uniref:Uncharacterized protein n=1 Tax=Aspergillus niger ATCC 13496 TaxID=1353008 RepID=A0A370C5C1_ASPNG|nr:hypothetical protein M747DRAFT_162246 [Aspergillus niger ATCC 13496]
MLARGSELLEWRDRPSSYSEPRSSCQLSQLSMVFLHLPLSFLLTVRCNMHTVFGLLEHSAKRKYPSSVVGS